METAGNKGLAFSNWLLSDLSFINFSPVSVFVQESDTVRENQIGIVWITHLCTGVMVRESLWGLEGVAISNHSNTL